VTGYEIHAGLTRGGASVVSLPDGTAVGMADGSGWILGCYLHGLLHNNGLRQGVLTGVAQKRGKKFEPAPPRDDELAFDRLAEALRATLDLPLLERLTGIAL
jgi:adenosylcobyric acid synthase